jgi:hypothetical protein
MSKHSSTSLCLQSQKGHTAALLKLLNVVPYLGFASAGIAWKHYDYPETLFLFMTDKLDNATL